MTYPFALYSNYFRFVESKNINQKLVELGPTKLVTVDDGEVGIGYDSGKLEVLQPGQHKRTSQTWRIAQFLSIRDQVKRLERLVVNTNDGVQICVNAIITFKIIDAEKACREVTNVIQALSDRAEATLTSTFLHHSIDEIAPTLPKANKEKKGIHHHNHEDKGKEVVLDQQLFSDIVREAFMTDLKEFVTSWGIALLDMSIEKLEFSDKVLKQLLTERAANKLKTAADKANIAGQVTTGIKKAEGEAEQQKIIANAELYTAEQRAKAARLLDTPLARELAILKAQKEIIEAAGSKATFIPWNMKIDINGGQEGNNNSYWLQERPEGPQQSQSSIRNIK